MRVITCFDVICGACNMLIIERKVSVPTSFYENNVWQLKKEHLLNGNEALQMNVSQAWVSCMHQDIMRYIF